MGAVPAGAPEAPERLERGGIARGPFAGVHRRVGVRHEEDDEGEADSLDIADADHGAASALVVKRFRAFVFASVEVGVEGCERLCGLVDGVVGEAAPDFHLGDRARGELGDDAEVIGATFERTPEVAVRGSGCCDH